ncbi:ATP-binding cassette domain-containing protein [Subtercola frigoramans]|uniref:ABC-type sugar transport system ATPase subunit n=1 Tax=Subtercola frigoramans TaxID=120298 RepID=A0ABS2L2D7_9MICO|nr:ATP-binding cassette domain-containing protein [Subtercola frigoramans]MBM7470656.1 ABC-type sugar transport system ATPase subunit [Subtercola frigoramans]
MPGTTASLTLTGIGLNYGFVKALDGVDFTVRAGEIVAVLGDNGAGKSTLLKVMSGAHRPSEGTIEVDGQLVDLRSPRDASDAGIQMVYQDLALIDAADVATNLTLGREPVRKGPLGWLGILDKKAMRREAASELEALGVTTAPVSRPVEMLSGGQRQVVALARSAVRAHASGKGVLLLDEPTAALGYAQTRQVEDLIKRMATRKIAVVVVTHNLPLCFEVADRIVVLNRGRKVADIATNETDNDSVVGWITGSKAPQEGIIRASV